MKKILVNLLVFLFLSGFISVYAQQSQGGYPASRYVSLKQAVHNIDLSAPDMQMVEKQDQEEALRFKPTRMAVNVAAGIDFAAKASWELVDNIWIGRLRISVEQAKGLILYYDDFYLPKKSKLFVYNDAMTQLLGAFSAHNNPPKGLFANEMVLGESVILEYNYPDKELIMPTMIIGEVGYAYRYTHADKSFGDSGSCEVNVNCSEGNDWRDEQRGVVRILLRIGGSAYWCSGSLINNTSQDYTPYILSADHCGGDASESDLQQWIFYFNYEASGCDNPTFEPESSSMVGAEKISRSGTEASDGSDFYLVELNDMVPADYNAYFNGWSRSESPASQGVCIHHPQGDIKKISTFTQPLMSETYISAYDAHWEVYWSATANGHGVTEGGSSGSPLFNSNGLIVGTLTGGYSSCSALEMEDFYGKFSYSWDQNGTETTEQLEPWLDPLNIGTNTFNGMGGQPTDVLYSSFQVIGDTSVTVGTSASFQSLAVGSIVEWLWTFEGGYPETSTAVNPEDIVYKSYGTYDVSLTVVDSNNDTATLVREDYIFVNPLAYPVPVSDIVTLDFGNEPIGHMKVNVYNVFGGLMYSVEEYLSTAYTYQMDISFLPNGIYILESNANEHVTQHKIVKADPAGE